MHYSGSVYRPPSEAYSLIVQCTLGCSHNRCAFCIMYKDKTFSVNPLEQVLGDLAEARAYYPRVERIFLADGDALILPMDYLLAVLDSIRELFPECERVSAYASTKALMKKTDAELQTLCSRGLTMVYVGLETGLESLLKKYDKGVNVEEIIEHSLRAKAAGMTLSVTAINGMGGKEQSEEHAVATAAALSRIKADYVAMLTLRVYSGTPLHDWIERGELTMLGPKELAAENRIILQHIDSEGSIFRSNHASNYLPLKGTLNRDREALIEQIDKALAGEVRFRRAVELGL
ncbi:MAG: B12-binding domain-containing radical SAM protein [Oscillospiraceae bacterium]|nr:B12-binding domain-containing radical SAM protein [Oscillospiraceae bacterium]